MHFRYKCFINWPIGLDIFVPYFCKVFCKNMLNTDHSTDAQNPDPRKQDAIFSLFIFEETEKLSVVSTKTPLNVSVPFVFHTNIHIVYFKTVRGHVDIRFASWSNVMKKMKFAAENWILCKKCDISKTVKYIDPLRDGFGNYLAQNHFRKQKLKSGITFKNWKQKYDKRVFTKSAKTMSNSWNLERK